VKDIVGNRVGDRGRELPDDILLGLLENAERPFGELLQGEGGITHEGPVEHVRSLDLPEGKKARVVGMPVRRHSDEIVLLSERKAVGVQAAPR